MLSIMMAAVEFFYFFSASTSFVDFCFYVLHHGYAYIRSLLLKRVNILVTVLLLLRTDLRTDLLKMLLSRPKYQLDFTALESYQRVLYTLRRCSRIFKRSVDYNAMFSLVANVISF